jgi:putative ABC transport system permease protein
MNIVVRNLADLAAQQSGLLTTVMWVVTVTSVLLLLTGMAGIAVLMLLVVRQRRSEIGLRRAIGATPFDIALQFFIEGIALAGTGIAGGVIAGSGASALVARVLESQFAAGVGLPLIAAMISLVVASIACVVPAIIAARLEPSIALA